MEDLLKSKISCSYISYQEFECAGIPTFKDKIKARKAEIPVWGLEDLKEYVKAEDVGLSGSPTKVKKLRFLKR